MNIMAMNLYLKRSVIIKIKSGKVNQNAAQLKETLVREVGS